jgi:hypothetical protein
MVRVEVAEGLSGMRVRVYVPTCAAVLCSRRSHPPDEDFQGGERSDYDCNADLGGAP